MAINKSVKFDIKAQDKSGKAFASVKNRLSGLTNSLGGLKSALGAAFAVGAITAFAKSTLGAADTIAKIADSTGLSTDALQTWRKVAGLAGVQQQAFDQGMQGFNKRLGEARVGTGSLVTFLEKYDKTLLSALQTTQNTDQAFKVLIDAMLATEDVSLRAALAGAAVGRSLGSDLVNLVRGGREEIDAMTQRVRDLGLVLEEDLLRGAEGANDELSLLGDVVKTTLQRAFLKLAPMLTDIARILSSVLTVAINVVTVAWAAQRKMVVGVIETMLRWGAAVNEVIGELSGAEFFTRLAEEGRRLADSMTLVTGTTTEFKDSASAASGAVEGLVKSTAALGAVSKKTAALTKSLESGLDQEAARIKRVTETTEERIDAEKRLLTVLLKSGRINDQDALRRLDQLSEICDKAVESGDCQKKTADEVGTKWEDTFAEVESSLTSFVDQGEFDLKSLGALAPEIFSSLLSSFDIGDKWKETFATASASLSAFIEQGKFDLKSFGAVALDILKSVLASFNTKGAGGAGGLGGLFASITGGGGSAGGGGFGDFFKGLLGLQHGGSFNVGGQGGADSQVVAFRATPGENVTVTPAARGASGGGTINLYQIDARGSEIGVEERIRRVLQQERPGIVEAGGNRGLALVTARARSGGPFATAIGAR